MKQVTLIGIALLAGAAGIGGYAWWGLSRTLPNGLIQANGRIEGDEISVASEFAGRIVKLGAEEGDQVQEDQVLVELDDTQIRARFEQARQAFAVADARVEEGKAEVKAAEDHVRAAKTALSVLKKEVPLDISKAEAQLEHAEATAATADSTEGKARRDYERNVELMKDNAVSQERLDASKVAWVEASNQLTVAQAAVVRAEKDLAHAKLGEERIREQEDQLAALESDLEKARAALEERKAARGEAAAARKEAESILDDLTITSPSDGTITTRMVEIGEVITPGAPLLDLVDLDALFLKVYVPERKIGKVRLGLPARIYTDAFPEQPFKATVRFIASEAEFTPKEVQTPDERVKFVYAVKLYLESNPDHRLTPGLPADAVIRWKKDTPWHEPQW